MRRKIVAGNWKMNLTKSEALSLYNNISSAENLAADVEKMIFAPLLFLDALKQNESGLIKIGAQNFYSEAAGAFTGEVSFSQLKDLGIRYVLVGHSERRVIFKEEDELVKAKVNAAINAGLKVIFCCGESLEIRETGTHISFVVNQLKNNVFQLPEEAFGQIVIAYEPIWAIGTGKTATPEQAEEMHEQIRLAVAQHYSNYLAEQTPILYGGSCNAGNAKELFAKPNIDGGLIGGASLKTANFIQIINSF